MATRTFNRPKNINHVVFNGHDESLGIGEIGEDYGIKVVQEGRTAPENSVFQTDNYFEAEAEHIRRNVEAGYIYNEDTKVFYWKQKLTRAERLALKEASNA
jgi:hypothetical protein